MSKSMTTRLIPPLREASQEHTTKLLVAWRNPVHKAYLLIGSVVHVDTPNGEVFEFSYRKDVEKKPLFHRIPGFDDVDRVYRSKQLFPFLAGRIMSDSRPDRGRWLDAIGASKSAGPLEILSHSFGVRANDTYELFAAPSADEAEDTLAFDVLVHGTRYQEPQDAVHAEINLMAPGSALKVIPEPENGRDSRAHAIHAPSGQRLGYVPAPVLDYLQEYCTISGHFTAETLRVNPEELGPHLRLVMRLTYHARS
ncbi:hypothetical protein GCM10027403_07970 [Arthrobacter tecti]